MRKQTDDGGGHLSMSLHGRRAFVPLVMWRLTDEPLVEEARRYFAMPEDTQFTLQYTERRQGYQLWCTHPSFPAYATWAEVPEEVWDHAEVLCQ